ncbi:hypothetical protein H5U98_06835 [Mycolicibacterium boenickei]|uniref:Uncharacterized protein n=1 Tax=Mycolicibacterium boenickei TaxID=146017 RepID=A0AAX3A1T3_9MYCO|nr:hypothetical protein [Mycolicibacterium boenickei]UNC01103.1 hypothetical protein H5U98_06835 [Mycolicibacterium boenickei]BBX90948.1 hypothetical protein MBOE_25970 [Mycolicibacterium boenickei]
MTTKQVRYTGALPGVKLQREMSRQDWALLGIKSGPHVWSAANGYALPASDFTAEHLKVLSGTSGFEVT